VAHELIRGRLVRLLLGVTGAALGLMSAAELAVEKPVIKHLGSRLNALTATSWQ
jgi:hypothetical protein